MNSKKFVKTLFFFILLTVSLLFGFNFFIDPIGQFHSIKIDRVNAQKNSVNHYERIYKFYDLKHNMLQYNSFLFGTSRTDHFKSEDLEKYTHDKVYNISLAASTPNEQIYFLRYILQHHPKINFVIFSIDFFSYNPSSSFWDDFDKDRFLDNQYKDFTSYTLSINALKLSYNTLKGNWNGKKSSFYPSGAINTSGHSQYKFNRKKFDTMLTSFNILPTMYNSEVFQKPHSIDAKLNIFREMITMLKNKHIKFKVFIPPISYEQQKLIREKGLETTYQYWKTQVTKIAGTLYDFNYKNRITTNNNNFMDSSHIRPIIAPLIYQQLFDYNSHKKFGKLFISDHNTTKPKRSNAI